MRELFDFLLNKKREAVANDRRHFVISSKQLGNNRLPVGFNYSFRYKRGDITFICIMF